VDERRAGEVAGQSKVNQVPAKVEEKAVESRTAKSMRRSPDHSQTVREISL
jgi:hypothetical protein